MQIEERLRELKDKINEKVPKGITVSQVEFEGPELVLYTDDPKRFADEADLIKILARDLRKRIVVRPTILEEPEKAVGKGLVLAATVHEYPSRGFLASFSCGDEEALL
jgi:predicted metal-dependent RNase